MEDFEELRRLLLSREQEQIRELNSRLEDKERRVQDVAAVLPHAVKLSLEKNGDLDRTLQPSIENSLRLSIQKRPEIFVEAFHPIIGPIVRRSIAESLRGLLQSLNRTLENTFSWQGLKWRFEALRTGKSFGEIVMLRSMVYQVEQVFLIHRETSLSLLYVARDPAAAKDSDMVAGMLSAIQDFARDSFEAGADAVLEEFRVGELEVWIAPGRHAYLAAVIRGSAPRELSVALQEAIESVHILKTQELAAFEGDSAVFESVRPELEACLRAQYQPQASSQIRQIKAWLALAGTAAVLLSIAWLAWKSDGEWSAFLRRLNAEPGLAVTANQHNWFFKSSIEGLRDPLAADPAPLAATAGVDPTRVVFHWKEYLALDSASVRRRFEKRFPLPNGTGISLKEGALEVAGSVPFEWIERVRREVLFVPGINQLNERGLKLVYDPARVLEQFTTTFPPPAGLIASFQEGTLKLSGKAPYEWIAPVREGAKRIPGIAGISEKELEVVFNPAGILSRFESRFGLPDTVSASIENGTLMLSGEASHAWLTRVRPAAVEIPGISAVQERSLIDLDEQTFRQSKSVIETALVYFLPNKENFATEGFVALSRLPDEIRRFQVAAKRIGTAIGIEIRGSADSVGSEVKNIELSERRAKAVFDFLVSCGLDAAMFKPLGLGAPLAPGEKAAPEQVNRRVAFRVVSPPSSIPP